MSLILASASLRRRELLARIGVRFEVRSTAIDETPQQGETAAGLARRLAHAKARAMAPGAGGHVLAADTVVAIGTRILGKPSDAAEAEAMLALLSGAEHQVVTSVVLLTDPAGVATGATVISRVWFRALAEADRGRCAASPEALDAAGAYAIQGAAAVCVARVVGSYSNVVGLPLAETAELLGRAALLR